MKAGETKGKGFGFFFRSKIQLKAFFDTLIPGFPLDSFWSHLLLRVLVVEIRSSKRFLCLLGFVSGITGNGSPIKDKTNY